MEIRDLATFLDYLGSVHARTHEAISRLDEAHLSWQPAEGEFTAGEVALHMWLAKEGIARDKVQTVNIAEEDLPIALAKGNVDGIIWPEPMANSVPS